MKHAFKTGFSFGSTSGIITTLGLMIGLHSGTHSRLVIIGGILTIAIADAFSDALGIHVSEEYANHHTAKSIWGSTIFTFLSKFFVALTFVFPLLLLQLPTAIIASLIWGLSLLCTFSFYIAKKEKLNPLKVVMEHFLIAVTVIIIAHLVGDWIRLTFV